MRTLLLLAALLLVAFQARAMTLQETADQVPTQDQPEAEDQDMAITFTGEERPTREASGPGSRISCFCTHKRDCNFPNKIYGTCLQHGRRYRLCCR